MIREELRRLVTWEERHRQLVARLTIALTLTLVVDAVGSVMAWWLDEGAKRSDIRSFGDAVFFATVQLLTVSSSLMNL